MSECRNHTVQIETHHTDVVHDTQFDYYGQLVATASSDGTVKIINTKDHAVLATLRGHEGPVWTVAWAHPRFGTILASASFDARVLIWKESQERGTSSWRPVHLITTHTGSVNCVTWAPQEYGAVVASASSDGSLAVTRCTTTGWSEPIKVAGEHVAHAQGATGVSFAPWTALRSSPVLASGGCDGTVKLWCEVEAQGNSFKLLSEIKIHTDWVRDVQFSPDGSSPFVTLASCGQDKKVAISRKRQEELTTPGTSWEISVTEFKETVWRLSWSPCGTMLLVTTGDNEVLVLTEGKSFTDPWTTAPINTQ